MSEKIDCSPNATLTSVTSSSSDKPDPLKLSENSSLSTNLYDDGKPNKQNLHLSQDYSIGITGSEKHEWRGKLFRFGPLSGILAFLVAISSTAASLGVLVGSNHSLVERWPTPPSTYIAIATAIGNVAMRYAAVQGIVVAWWMAALRGSSLRELHYNWRAGTSFHGAMMAGKNMGWLGVASIFSYLVIIVDGPLFQRSSTVVTASNRGPAVSLHFAMVPEIPTDYTGVWLPSSNDLRWNPVFNETIPSPDGRIPNTIFAGGQNLLSPLVPLWAGDKPIAGAVSGCVGSCTAQLIAPALAATSCVKYQREVDYKAPWAFDDAFGQKQAPPLGHESFIIGTALDVSGEYEKINTITAYAPSHGCSGHVEFTICSLEAAVGEYNITVERDQISISTSAAASPRIIGVANNTAVKHSQAANGMRPSTLAGAVNAAHLIWDSYVFTAKANGSTTVSGDGAHANLLFQRGTYNESECPAFTDPREEYMASLNKLMVYLGSYAAQGIANPDLGSLDPGLEVNASTTGHITGTRSVFDTNYSFFAGAALVEVICICLIVPTYWGWWEIGRAVSLSPLEIAKAFEAPILSHVNSNSSAVDIAKACSDSRIRYGSVVAPDQSVKLAFAESETASWPRRGCIVEV